MKEARTNLKAGTIAMSLAVFALGLSACSILKPPKRPEQQTFMLEASSLASNEAPAQDNSSMEPETRVLRVAAMASSAVYDTQRMAYMRSAGEIEYFASHRWADPPSEMLMPILISGLERTNRFPALVGPSSRAVGDLVLETELLAFRQEFTQSKPQFHASIRASVMDSRHGVILGSPRTFDVVEPMDEAKPTAGVRAAGRAAERMVDAIARYVVDTTEAAPALNVKIDAVEPLSE